MDLEFAKKMALYDEFEKTDPMPSLDRKVNPECKEAWDINKPSLYFEYEYTKDEDTIGTLEDNDVDTSQYITPESLANEEKLSNECQDKLIEHQETCTNIMCLSCPRPSCIHTRSIVRVC